MPQTQLAEAPVRQKRKRISSSKVENRSSYEADRPRYPLKRANIDRSSTPETKKDEVAYDEKKGRALDMLHEYISDCKREIRRNSEDRKSVFQAIEEFAKTAKIVSYRLESDKKLADDILNSLKLLEKEKDVSHLLKIEVVVNRAKDKEDYKKIAALTDDIVKNDSTLAKSNLKRLLDSKDNKTITTYTNNIINDYKKSRTDEALKRTNVFLEERNLKIEVSEYAEMTHDQMKALRAAFSGFFKVPDDIDNFMHSKAFKNYLKEPRIDRNSKDYDLSKSTAWQDCAISMAVVGVNVGTMEMRLQLALSKIKMPPELLKDLNVSDFGRVLFDEYANQPNNNFIISFDNIISGGSLSSENIFKDSGIADVGYVNDGPAKDSEGINKKFWKDHFLKDVFINGKEIADNPIRKDLESKGVDPKYVTYMFDSMLEKGVANPKVKEGEFKGLMPTMEIHHKVGIQDAAKLGNDFAQVNAMTNFMAIPVFANDDSHDTRHLTDKVFLCLNENLTSENSSKYVPLVGDRAGKKVFVERVVELMDLNSTNGKTLIYSSGSRPEENFMSDVRPTEQEHFNMLVRTQKVKE